VKADAVPPPEPVKPKARTQAKGRAHQTPPSPLDTSSLANLIDKALPKAPKKTLDTSKLAKELGNAAPRTPPLIRAPPPRLRRPSAPRWRRAGTRPSAAATCGG
jgi:hypothetical protein